MARRRKSIFEAYTNYE